MQENKKGASTRNTDTLKKIWERRFVWAPVVASMMSAAAIIISVMRLCSP